MNCVQVKTYLFPNNTKVSLNSLKEVDEIRRFNLSLEIQSNVSLYKSLIEKIRQAYGSFLPNESEIKTYWQDDENELIGFSSDSELQYAIDVLAALNISKPYKNNLLFKIYVARKTQPSGFYPKQEETPQVHLGVVCDACDGSIIGIRYKCSVCPDYDLCEDCNGKGLHKEHSMNKITKPRGCPFQGFDNQGQGQGQRWKRRQQRQCNKQNNPFENIMRNFMNVPQFAANQVPLVNNPEQLKNFGENLKKFLDPFGIDVSYYVDSLNQENNQTKPEEKKTPESSQDKEKQKEKEAEAASASAMSTATTSASATSTATNSDSATSTATASTTTTPAVTENQPTIHRSESIMDESIEDITEPLLKEKDHTMPRSDKSKPSAPESEPSLIDLQKSINENAPFQDAYNALKSVINSSASNLNNQETTEAAESMVDGFNLVDMQQATGDIERELKIIKAIEQLKSMGYADDGGWLTRLVSAKKGNINAVLDSLTPGPRQ